MPSLCSTPTQAAAQPVPAHVPCPHHLPDQPPSHPSQSQLQGSSQHHPALPALLHLPGLSVLTRPATHPLALPAEEQQPIMPFSTSPLAALPGEQGPSTPAPLQQGAIHCVVNTPADNMPSASMQPPTQPQPQPQPQPLPLPPCQPLP
ncbi:hypothetical protein QJQ45_023801 [Haematococcus lacustris]|nr:hypothetical protein QJQ45_023801 [Haematococcus lacustris]